MRELILAEFIGSLLDPISLVIAVIFVLVIKSVVHRKVVVIVIDTVLLTIARETITYKEPGEVWGDALLWNLCVAVVQVIVVVSVITSIMGSKTEKIN